MRSGLAFDLDLAPGALEALSAAAAAPAECDAWRIAQGNTYSTESKWAHLAAAHEIAEVAAPLRGIALPSPAWIRTNCEYQGARPLPLWCGYPRYYSRLLLRGYALVRAGGRRFAVAWRRYRPRQTGGVA